MKRRIATLFLIVFVDMLGGSAIIPILPVFVVGQFHATPFQAALVITMFYVAQVLAAPVLGNLSDRVGRRPVLLISQAGTILSYLLIVLAGPLGAMLDHTGLHIGIAGGLIIIYVARLLDGATGGNITVALAYASDISSPEERTRVLGLVGGASGVGHIMGPAVAGLLASFGLLTPFLGAVVISAVTWLLTLLWLQEVPKAVSGASADAAKQEKVPLLTVLGNRPVVHILAMVLGMGLFMAALFGTLALYTDRVLLPNQPEKIVVGAVGAIITVIGLVTAVVQLVLLKPVVSFLGERKAVLLGCILLLASAVGFFAFPNLWAFIGFMVIFAFGTGVISPTLQSFLTRVGSEQMAGQLLGLYQSMFSLALIFGPVIGGLLFDAVSPQAVFAASAGLMVLTLVLSIGVQRLPLASVDQKQEA
ncbi:MAG TPA: MFS transporter, partial [Ktedonobacterales bacterium]